MISAPRRTALRYFGGKWKLAPWIIKHFPDHITYVEPFGGAASVLLRKFPSAVEVYNDLFDGVINFFKVLRERPAELIAVIDLTPYSRREYKRAQQQADDELESARRFYVHSWQGRSCAGNRKEGGWRYLKTTTRSKTVSHDFAETRHLWTVARRLKLVQIESDDALDVIVRYDTPDALFYVDPPYVDETRRSKGKRDRYHHEYVDDDHRQLADLLHGIEGMVILSGRVCPLYDELYPDWSTDQHNAVVSDGQNGGKTVLETLWISPNAQAHMSRQLSLKLLR